MKEDEASAVEEIEERGAKQRVTRRGPRRDEEEEEEEREGGGGLRQDAVPSRYTSLRT